MQFLKVKILSHVNICDDEKLIWNAKNSSSSTINTCSASFSWIIKTFMSMTRLIIICQIRHLLTKWVLGVHLMNRVMCVVNLYRHNRVVWSGVNKYYILWLNLESFTKVMPLKVNLRSFVNFIIPIDITLMIQPYILRTPNTLWS